MPSRRVALTQSSCGVFWTFACALDVSTMVSRRFGIRKMPRLSAKARNDKCGAGGDRGQRQFAVLLPLIFKCGCPDAGNFGSYRGGPLPVLGLGQYII